MSDTLAVTDEARRIAEQNDQFRRSIVNGFPPDRPQGRVLSTRAVASRGEAFQIWAALAVSTDTAFTEDNDPYGDHSFGAVTVQGETVWWKIDLYDLAYEGGSETPDDPTRTRRVLTILFPADY